MISTMNRQYAMDTQEYKGLWGANTTVSPLYSPPNIPGHKTFTTGNMSHISESSSKPESHLLQAQTYGSRQPVTPPISPETLALKHLQPSQEPSSNIDPPLYSPDVEAPVSPTSPLFDTFSTADTESLIDQYAARPYIDHHPSTKPPTRDEYDRFCSVVNQLYNADPRGYRRRVEETDRQYTFGRTVFGPENKPAASPRAMRKAVSKPQRRSKVIGTTSRPRRDRPLSAKARETSIDSKSSKAPVGSIVFEAVNQANQVKATKPPKPTRPAKPVNSAKPPKVSRSAQDNFGDYPDYCPPLSTLEGKKLKISWQAAEQLDLSNDPHRNLLHPDEVVVASTIRMTGAQYLLNKRRLFIERIRCMQKPKEKEFRKTDAQGACCIDVNKASKLHTAYENVGWLDRKHFEQYVHIDMPQLSKGT